MKVAMVTAFPDDPQSIVGGVAGVAKYLADEYARVPDVALIVVIPQGTDGAETVIERWGPVTVRRIARAGFWKFLSGTFYDIVAGRAQLKEHLEELAPDIVHFQGATFLAADYATRSVLTIHGIAEKDAVWDTRLGWARYLKCLVLKLTEDYGRRRVPRVILISDYVGQVLPEIVGRKVWRIDNPIADSFFDVPWESEPGRVFCCSRVMPRKNILGMLEAFARVVRLAPEARLRIAGSAEPDYLRACMRQVELSGLRDSVRFLGSLSVADVQRELSKANVFALPSFQETSPLSIAEAMAVGVPVVAAGVGGIPDMVDDGATGFLIDPRDPSAIGDALIRIIADKDLALAMGRRAKKTVRERSKASVVARRTLDVYREIAAEPA